MIRPLIIELIHYFFYEPDSKIEEMSSDSLKFGQKGRKFDFRAAGNLSDIRMEEKAQDDLASFHGKEDNDVY